MRGDEAIHAWQAWWLCGEYPKVCGERRCGSEADPFFRPPVSVPMLAPAAAATGEQGGVCLLWPPGSETEFDTFVRRPVDAYIL